MITKRYKLYKNYGKCLEISNGDIRALVTVDIGPRVIFYGVKGFNIMHEDIDRAIQKGGQFFDDNFKAGEKWYLYGGHRIWKAEEDMFSYVPDNYPVKVERLDNGAIFTPPIQKLTGLQQFMKVTMDEDGRLTIEESLTNTKEDNYTLSIWGLSVLRQGGTEIIPLNHVDTGLLPQQNFVWWPYNDKKDKRWTENTKYALLKQKKTIERPFKIGIFNHLGYVAYSVGKLLMVKRFDVKGGKLPDYECNFESYTNNEIMEMEVLSPMVTLSQNETITQVETFEIYKDVRFNSFSDEDIDNTFKSIGFKA